MPELPHLMLPRAEMSLERRKRPGYGVSPTKNFVEQSSRIGKAVDEVLEGHAKLLTSYVNPALILRVRTSVLVSEEDWLRAGLTVLGHDEGNSVDSSRVTGI